MTGGIMRQVHFRICSLRAASHRDSRLFQKARAVSFMVVVIILFLRIITGSVRYVHFQTCERRPGFCWHFGVRVDTVITRLSLFRIKFWQLPTQYREGHPYGFPPKFCAKRGPCALILFAPACPRAAQLHRLWSDQLKPISSFPMPAGLLASGSYQINAVDCRLPNARFRARLEAGKRVKKGVRTERVFYR
jgi:hypothetical protein